MISNTHSGEIITKSSIARELVQSGKHEDAMKIVHSFKILGEHKDAIQQYWEVMKRESFYRQIGKDVSLIKTKGIAALEALYGQERKA